MFTNPAMYLRIADTTPLRTLYGDALVASGAVSRAEVDVRTRVLPFFFLLPFVYLSFPLFLLLSLFSLLFFTSVSFLPFFFNLPTLYLL